ncbi:hypothetical protein [Klugiella xanthotipulae]|nr:hypothetical protein [Klugiella xanthotipulae]
MPALCDHVNTRAQERTAERPTNTCGDKDTTGDRESIVVGLHLT